MNTKNDRVFIRFIGKETRLKGSKKQIQGFMGGTHEVRWGFFLGVMSALRFTRYDIKRKLKHDRAAA